MHQHIVEVNVACSVEEVYNLWQRVENVPRLMPLVKEVEIIKGSDDLSLWKFGLGFPLLTQWTSHITQRVPQKLIAWESVSGLKQRLCRVFFLRIKAVVYVLPLPLIYPEEWLVLYLKLLI